MDEETMQRNREYFIKKLLELRRSQRYLNDSIELTYRNAERIIGLSKEELLELVKVQEDE